MSDKATRLVAEVDSTLKDRADADPRTIKDVVESALEREFSTGDTAAVERRIDEKKQRIQTLQREINERNRELAKEKDELERLQNQLQEFKQDQQTKLEEVREKLENTPKEESNPAIKKWAAELGMTPAELLDQL